MTMTCDFLKNLFDRSRKLHYICIHKQQAKVAQLVERNLAKVEVASSNLVFRSKSNPFSRMVERDFFIGRPRYRKNQIIGSSKKVGGMSFSKHIFSSA